MVSREKLNFDLDGDIPRFWLDNNAFQTRFFDAMSTMFPEGERFFIACVRDYRDLVTGESLKADIKCFIRQEAQHSMVHEQFNKRLKAQGINVDFFERIHRFLTFKVTRRFAPKSSTISSTAASEHLTAIMAHSLFQDQDVFAKADPRVKALFAWHAMEEYEHRTVAFDVMQKVAKVGYLRRGIALFQMTIIFNLHIWLMMGHMLRVDGFNPLTRTRMWIKGSWWLYNPINGLLTASARPFLSYLRPGFHPSQAEECRHYLAWVAAFQRSGDPIEAGLSIKYA